MHSEEVTARRGETGEDEERHREWSTGQAAASSVGGEHGPRGELVPAYTTSLLLFSFLFGTHLALTLPACELCYHVGVYFRPRFAA